MYDILQFIASIVYIYIYLYIYIHIYIYISHQQIINRPEIFSAGRAEGQSPVLPRRRGRRRAAAGGGHAGGGRRLRQLWRGKGLKGLDLGGWGESSCS